MSWTNNTYFFLNILFIIGGSGGIIVSFMMYARSRNNNFLYYGIALGSWMLSQFCLLFFYFANELVGKITPLANLILNDLSYFFLGFFILFFVFLVHKYFQKPAGKIQKMLVDLHFGFMIFPILVTGELTDNIEIFSNLEMVKGVSLFILLYYYAFFIKNQAKQVLNKDIKKILMAGFYISMILYPLMIVDSVMFFNRVYPFGFSINSLFYFIINLLYLYIISGYVELPALIRVDQQKRFQEFVEKFGLTPREKDVVSLLLEGKSYKGIAEGLYISHETVKTHVNNIYKKTGASSKVELINLVNSP